MTHLPRQFDVVRVSSIRDERFLTDERQRHPRVGDVGAVLEVYECPEVAFEVECSDPETGATLWQVVMYPDELEPIPPVANAGPLLGATTPDFAHPVLTQGEWIVLEKLVGEVRPIDIARQLGINLGWVRHRFSFLRAKYGCEKIQDVQKLVQRVGLPPPPSSEA